MIAGSFTFQSGDIQIYDIISFYFPNKFYIPIWWYSNKDNPILIDHIFTTFTFQSGDIQILL